MSTGPYQITEVIGRQEASDFLRAIKITFEHMTSDQLRDVHLFDYQRNAVVISFDGKLRPFFGYTWAYNPEENRTYIQSGGFILLLIRSELRSRPHTISGGRVFLSRNGACHRNFENIEEDLCRWIWLGDTLDIVIDVRHLFQQAKNR